MTEDNPKVNESFIRWEAYTIAQLSYAINLILILSVAGIGFITSSLLSDKYNQISWLSDMFIISILLLLVSAAFGLWSIINRLRVFRATTLMERIRHEHVPHSFERLYKLTEGLDEAIWPIFWCQIAIFSAGIIAFVFSVISSVGNKL